MRRRVRFMTSRASPTGISGSRRERTAEKRGQSWEPSENFKDSEYVDEDEDENGNIVSEANEDFLFTGEPVMPSGPTVSSVPDLFTSAPPIRDQLKTATSDSQDATVDQCLPLLSGDEADGASPSDLNSHGLPKLDRRKHIKFLHTSLGKLPSGFVGLDATRPWMLYWALTGLFLLGEEVSQYRERVIATLSPMQNPDGGFGGGHGQMSHCAASYAAVLSLILVGGEEAWETIDRKTLWIWLGRLKQRDGGFSLCVGGEEDVRGSYCAMVMISLLNLPLSLHSDSPARVGEEATFLTGLPEYLSTCQTFEGGISGSPGNEAHGAYTFCALACFSIMEEPHKILHKYLDVPLLISWLSARQHAPEGGLAGRTNKLVDGCYSHWAGGCWPIIEAALNGFQTSSGDTKAPVGSLYSREGLIRYILCCCQQEQGGLRDKPEKGADSYHTCYVLAGLSSAQHSCHYSRQHPDHSAASLSAAFNWSTSVTTDGKEMNEREKTIFDEADRVSSIHPIFVLPWEVARECRTYFEEKQGF